MPFWSLLLRPRGGRRHRVRSAEQDGGQLAPAGLGGVVHRAPGFEELHELLTGRFVIPFTFPADDFHQVVGRAFPVACGVQRHGEVEAGLV